MDGARLASAAHAGAAAALSLGTDGRLFLAAALALIVRLTDGSHQAKAMKNAYAATVEEKLRCDLFYMNCRTLRLDLKLLLLTLIEFLRGFPRG